MIEYHVTLPKNETDFPVLPWEGLQDLLRKVQNYESTLMTCCTIYSQMHMSFFGRTWKSLLMVVILGKRDGWVGRV